MAPSELLGSLAHGADGRARLHTGPAAVLPLPGRTRDPVMTRADLTEAASCALNIWRKESETIVVTVLDSIVRALRSGNRVEIRPFDSFGARQRRSRVARNPETGARVKVPAKRIPCFRPSKELMELVNSASAPMATAKGPAVATEAAMQPAAAEGASE